MRGNTAEVVEEPLTVRDRIFRETYQDRQENGSVTPSNGNGYYSTSTSNSTYNSTGYDKFRLLATKQYAGKRLLDILVGSAGFIAFLLFYPVAFLGIKLFSRGPVIFKQKRTGQNGKTFTCYKFRTMYCVEKRTQNGMPDITRKGDQRIFPFGRFLRVTNLDELPQVINVLRGEMSLIGPRPYPVKECAHWNMTFDDFYYRYSVKPGLSGWAQVTGYRGGTLDEEHMRRRLDKDLIYVQKQSFGFDMLIIWKTILQMLHLNTNGH